MLIITKITCIGNMKKIVYLHGLETPQGGPKVEFLSSKASVYAPSINYEDKKDLIKKLDEINDLEPDLIIGSSMGGYVAYSIAQHNNIPVILFNPAVHSRSIEVVPFNKGDLKVKGLCVLGMKDDVIEPIPTLNRLRKEQLEFIKIEEMSHRVPFDIFVDIYNKYFNSL